MSDNTVNFSKTSTTMLRMCQKPGSDGLHAIAHYSTKSGEILRYYRLSPVQTNDLVKRGNADGLAYETVVDEQSMPACSSASLIKNTPSAPSDYENYDAGSGNLQGGPTQLADLQPNTSGDERWKQPPSLSPTEDANC